MLEITLLATLLLMVGLSATLMAIKYQFISRSRLRQLNDEIQWYKKALEFSGIGAYRWNSVTDQWYWSDKTYEIRGFPKNHKFANPEDFYGRVHPEDREALYAAEMECKEGGGPLNVEYRFIWSTGEIRWHHERADMIFGKKSEGSTMYGVVIDVTNERLRLEQTEIFASTDKLTGLPNRAAFERQFTAYLDEANVKPLSVVLAFMDLNGFKEINDRFGHEAGDQVLMKVAKNLAGRCDGRYYLCRLGGDEFVAITTSEHSNAETAAKELKNDLKAVFEESIEKDREFTVGVAIGISIYPQLADSASTLLSQADRAMYAAKRTGQRVAIFYYKPSPERGRNSASS